MFNKNLESNNNPTQYDSYSPQKQQDFHSFVDTFADAFVLFDEYLNCTSTNAAGEKLFGYKREDIYGKNIRDLLPQLSGMPIYEQFVDVINEDKPYFIEEDILLPESGEARLRLKAFKAGNGLGIVARDFVGNDSNGLKKESEELYNLFARYVSDVVYTMDMEMHLTYVSPSITRQQGYAVEEVMSLKPKDVMTPASARLFAEVLAEEIDIARQENADPSRSRIVELEAYRKDGSSLWTEQTITILRDNDGNPSAILGVARDISERKQAEKALSDSEAEISVLVENLADAVFRFKDGQLIWGNDRIVDMLGYKKDEFLYTDVNIFMPDENSLPSLYKNVSAGLKERGHFQGFTKVRRRDGSIADIEYTAAPVPNKVPMELVGVARDITERRQLIEELEKKEIFLRVLIENALDAFVILNGDGTIRYKSPSNERMQGYSSEERQGKDILEHIHPDDVSKVASDFAKLFNNPNEVIHTEIRVQHKDGHWLTIEATGKNFLDEPALECIVVNLRDVTERKHTLYQLEKRTQQILALQRVTASMQSAQGLKEILQLVAEGAVINLGFDHSLIFLRDGDIAHGTLFFTMAGSDFVCELEDAVIKTLTAAKIPVARGVNKVIDDAMDGKETISSSLNEVMSPSISVEECGTAQRLLGVRSVAYIPFFVGEEFYGGILAMTIRDGLTVDEIEPLKLLADHAGIAIENHRLGKELEQRVIERTKQLEAANSELESFAYSVSHDLRAPLRSIDGFSQILLEEYLDKLDNEGQDYLRRVRKGTQRMAELIDGILKLSRLTRGEMQVSFVDLSNLVQSIADELRQREQRDVEFLIAQGLIAQCDSNLIHAVIENLVSNAWKFTSKKEDARIEFGCTNLDDQQVYYVRDNGAGFSMEFADKLFVAFQRLHTVEEFEGTGIGLATVRRIIRRHGGEVWAEGEVDKGATFYFTLPRGNNE